MHPKLSLPSIGPPMLSCNSLFCLAIINAILRFVPFRIGRIRIGRGSWIKSKFSVGSGSSFGNFCVVRGSGPLEVGKYSAIGESVRFITSNHDTDRLSMNYLLQGAVVGQRFPASKMGVKVCNDVWIGDGAIVLPGVVIHNGAVVGAGSVVTRDVEAYSIVAGNPARELRKRFLPEIATRIEGLAWWDWEEWQFRKNARLFSLKCSENPHEFDRSKL